MPIYIYWVVSRKEIFQVGFACLSFNSSNDGDSNDSFVWAQGEMKYSLD